MGSKRIEFLDNIKGFAIILVILGHSYSNVNLLITWLNAFHMPLFFAVSGFLITSKKNLEYKLSKKIKSIIIPYVVFSLILSIFIGILKYKDSTNQLLIYIKSILVKIVTLQGYSVCWFLACLFVSEIIFIFLLRNTTKFRPYIFILLYAISLLISDKNIIYIPILRILMALFYLYIGYLLRNLKSEKKINLYPYTFLILIHIYLCSINGNTAIVSMDLNSKVFYVINSILGILLTWYGFKNYIFKSTKYLSYFGKNSIIIMVTHIIFIEIIKLLDYKLNVGICNLGYVEGIIVTLIVLLLEIPTIYIMNKYFYYLFGKKKQVSLN